MKSFFQWLVPGIAWSSLALSIGLVVFEFSGQPRDSGTVGAGFGVLIVSYLLILLSLILFVAARHYWPSKALKIGFWIALVGFLIPLILYLLLALHIVQ